MFEDLNEYITLSDCIDGHLYKIAARNGSFGVFSRKKEGVEKWADGCNSFTLSRWKLGSNYLFDEHHWDMGEPYGTVKPLEDLGPAPKFGTDEEMLRYLNGLTESEKDNQ